MAADSIRPQPFNYIPDQAKVREVRDIYNHVSVSNLQRLQDAHPIISDVDDRQQAIRQRSCGDTELVNFGFMANYCITAVLLVSLLLTSSSIKLISYHL